MTRSLTTIILAAGKGTRMKNPEKAKVMYEVQGKPMVQHVIELANRLNSIRIIAVVGYQREIVINHLQQVAPSVEVAIQDPQLGTGHAVLQTESLLRDYEGDILVLSGDVPMLRESTMRDFIDHHRTSAAVATILTADLSDPSGYGRILRDADGHVTGIIEHRDANPEQLKVKEINSGIYVFDKHRLFQALHLISPHNAQNEYYLPDVFLFYWKHQMRVSAKKAEEFDEIRGINTVEQLQEANQILERRSLKNV